MQITKDILKDTIWTDVINIENSIKIDAEVIVLSGTKIIFKNNDCLVLTRNGKLTFEGTKNQNILVQNGNIEGCLLFDNVNLKHTIFQNCKINLLSPINININNCIFEKSKLVIHKQQVTNNIKVIDNIIDQLIITGESGSIIRNNIFFGKSEILASCFIRYNIFNDITIIGENNIIRYNYFKQLTFVNGGYNFILEKNIINNILSFERACKFNQGEIKQNIVRQINGSQSGMKFRHNIIIDGNISLYNEEDVSITDNIFCGVGQYAVKLNFRTAEKYIIKEFTGNLIQNRKVCIKDFHNIFNSVLNSDFNYLYNVEQPFIDVRSSNDINYNNYVIHDYIKDIKLYVPDVTYQIEENINNFLNHYKKLF